MKAIYPVLLFDTRKADSTEQLGTKKKFWFDTEGRKRVLFKVEERGHGEDWSEKVACELATLLGVPHVHYDLAFDQHLGLPGVVTENFLKEEEALVHGNQMLLALDPRYKAEGTRFEVTQHTLGAVARVVRLLEPPVGCPEMESAEESATGAFAGYLLLDALIANQDRHHENWAAVKTSKYLRLAPSYDHASCLARNLKDDRRHRLMSNSQIPNFARKARSAIYESATDPDPMSTVAAFRGWARLNPPAADFWLTRLGTISDAAIADVLKSVPPDRMTSIGMEFTFRLLQENRRRILEGEEE